MGIEEGMEVVGSIGKGTIIEVTHNEAIVSFGVFGERRYPRSWIVDGRIVVWGPPSEELSQDSEIEAEVEIT